MAVKDLFKISRKTFFNPTRWLGFGEVKNNINITVQSAKGLFVADKPIYHETFKEAIARLNLTEATIQETLKQYLFYTYLFVICGAVTLFVSFYYLFHHNSLSGFLIGLSCSGLFLVQAFRFHFWYFQMQHRKLGCSIKEWWVGKID